MFQMAKVASRSWMRLLDDMLPNSMVTHFHVISEPARTRIEAIMSQTGDAQTFKYLSMPRLGRPPDDILPQIRQGKWIGPALTIVSGVRDPVARAISLVAFSCNRFGYTRAPVTVRDGGSAESLNLLFFKALRLAQSENCVMEGDTLLTQLAHGIHDYGIWFDQELDAGFGLDVFRTEFNHQARCLQIEGTNRVFVYRVEDLPTSAASAAMTLSASNFLGSQFDAVPPENTEGEARFRNLYKEFVRTVKLSKSDLDWFYDEKTVRHFYTDAEIDSFKIRWSS